MVLGFSLPFLRSKTPGQATNQANQAANQAPKKKVYMQNGVGPKKAIKRIYYKQLPWKNYPNHVIFNDLHKYPFRDDEKFTIMFHDGSEKTLNYDWKNTKNTNRLQIGLEIGDESSNKVFPIVSHKFYREPLPNFIVYNQTGKVNNKRSGPLKPFHELTLVGNNKNTIQTLKIYPKLRLDKHGRHENTKRKFPENEGINNVTIESAKIGVWQLMKIANVRKVTRKPRDIIDIIYANERGQQKLFGLNKEKQLLHPCESYRIYMEITKWVLEHINLEQINTKPSQPKNSVSKNKVLEFLKTKHRQVMTNIDPANTVENNEFPGATGNLYIINKYIYAIPTVNLAGYHEKRDIKAKKMRLDLFVPFIFDRVLRLFQPCEKQLKQTEPIKDKGTGAGRNGGSNQVHNGTRVSNGKNTPVNNATRSTPVRSAPVNNATRSTPVRSAPVNNATKNGGRNSGNTPVRSAPVNNATKNGGRNSGNTPVRSAPASIGAKNGGRNSGNTPVGNRR